MKITKYVHSCFLVETEDRVALFDPGVFSWKSGKFNIDEIDRIDRIVITHPHPDHVFPEFVKTVLDKFPEAHIVANQAVQVMLADAGIQATMRDETQCTCVFEAEHASIDSLAGEGTTPPNSGYHFQDRFTHPGDSNSFGESKEILAMPFIAPWGSVMEAIDRVVELKPKTVIPSHDWFWSQAGKDWLYEIVEKRLAKEGIELLVLEDGKTATV